MNRGVFEHPFLPAFLLGAIALTAVCGCTVVKHDEENKSQREEGLTFYFKDGSFDAAAYVADIWDDRVVPAFLDSSGPAADVLKALDKDEVAASEQYGRKAEVESPYSFMISGSAEITAANTDSAAATVDLAVDGYAGGRTVLMQIGPVIKKSAIRDSLEFITFGDFTNQLEYAGVSKELNFKVRDEVVTVLDRESLVGTRIDFHGAFILFPGEPILMTPVILSTGESDD